MYLIKYMTYIKHNKSNLISWRKWKEKADGDVNIPEHNLSTEHQPSYHIVETTLNFCILFTEYKIVIGEDSVLGAIYSESVKSPALFSGI